MSLRSQLKETALVLEIGSGSAPWPRADVLVDRFYQDDSGQRGGAEIYKDRRPLIVAAGEHLPFVDKAFDYVYCKHVIEHAEDIVAFLEEMSRVGKGGYLECPNPALERVLDPPQHLWYISNVNGRLRIHPKTETSRITGPYDRFYFHMMSDHFIIKHYWDWFVVKVEWTDRIEYEMCPSLDPVLVEPLPEERVADVVTEQKIRVLGRAWYDAVKEKVQNEIKGRLNSSSVGRVALQLRRRLRHKRRMLSGKVRIGLAELEPLLCCPYCKEKLTKSLTSYRCIPCGHEYPIQNGAAVFL